MSVSLSNPKFPSAIEGKLRSVRWRHGALIGTRAFAAAWFVLITLMILSMAIDWLFPFMDVAIRVFLTVATLVATTGTLVVLGWRPLKLALGWDHAASSVDDEIPELEQRWSTVASLSRRDPTSQSPIERAMAVQVTSEAIAMERIVHPKQVAPPVSPQRTLMAAGACSILLVAIFLAVPGQVSVLLKRFWAPTADITATRLSSLTGDRLVPRGERVDLVTQLDGVQRSTAVLMVQDVDGTEQTYKLRATNETPGQFAHTVRVDESLTYRVRSGDGQTDWHTLQAIDYPEIDEIQFSIDFPEYTGREPVHRERMPRRLKVVQGSTMNLAIKPLDPLQQLHIALERSDQGDAISSRDDSTPAVIYQLSADDGGWYRFRMQLLDDVVLRPTLTSQHGLENRQRLFSRIEVIADKPPVARVVSPTDEMAAAFDDTIEIQFEAHDDHGIASAELVVYDESRTDADGKPLVLDVKEIPLGDQEMNRHVMATTTLDLEKLELSELSEISYAIRVTDNRDVPLTNEDQDGSSMQLSSRGDSPESAADEQADVASNNANQSQGNGEQREQDRPRDDDLAQMLDFPIPSGRVESTDDPANSQRAGDSESEASSENADDPTLAHQQAVTRDTDGVAESSQDNPQEVADAGDMSEPTDANETEKVASRDPNEGEASQTGAEALSNQTPSALSNQTPSELSNQTPSGVGEDREDGERNEQAKDGLAANRESTDPNRKPMNQDGQGASRQNQPESARSNLTGGSRSQNSTNQPPPAFTLRRQSSRSGQNTLTGRRRLKITDRLAALASADDRPGEELEVRENVIVIDQMLAQVEAGLRLLVERKIADSDRAEQFRRVDIGLGDVESYVSELREKTRENQYAFVGLQMVDITRTHVTPARDRVFSAIQRPNASDADATVSLQHVFRARELLAALLNRYDRVQQERKLQEALDETVTMYEVYLEKRRMLLREARQNLNPLQRKMAVIEVDQEYLDRLAEVTMLRREMMDEFAQMLGDDPRLLSRYLELVKRRGKSLRDRLSEISQRQYEATEESLGWLQIDESQKQDLWTIYIELRLQLATELAKDAAEFAERIEKQMPLEIDTEVGTAAELIRQARGMASSARQVSFDAERWLQPVEQTEDLESLTDRARSLVSQIERLSATLDQLQFEHEGNEAFAEYVEPRSLEAHAVADQADAWSVVCEDLATQNFAGIVATEQHRLAFETQILRVEMLEMRSELDGQFQQVAETSLPDEIANMIEQLHPLMEAITFNQAATAFRARRVGLEAAARQQQLATGRLEQAEELFDRIRRAVVRELDQYDVQDPNIADLLDPTLDEFLARLEREPSIAAQLGIPNRRRNLRVIADSVFWQQNGGGGLGDSGEAAARRAQEAMRMSRKAKQQEKKEPKQLSEEEREQREKAKAAQEELEKSLLEIEKRGNDPATPEDQRRQLLKMAEEMKQLLKQSDSGDVDAQVWQQLVQSDEAKAVLGAIARGEMIPDQQWNKLLSTLDDGLWQVRGKQPPEVYRKAIEQYEDQIRELMQTIDEG